MKRMPSAVLCVLAGLVLLSAIVAGGTPAAGADAPNASATQDEEEFPRAEAGLDQTVQRNASVLLDATESFSPEGEIVEYSWYITAPSGDTIIPDCDSADCGRGRFRATELGEYEVMVAVEDDEGRRETDTLYVTTVPRGEFAVDLQGPANATGEQANLTATVSPGDAQVQNLTWYRSGRELRNHSVPELGGIFEHSTYIVPGATYRVVAADQFNRTVEDTWTAPGGGAWTPSGPSSDRYPRIEGPGLVTGEYDGKKNGEWQFKGTSYKVVTSERGSVTEVIWGLSNQDSDDFGAKGTVLETPLDPGVNTVVANLDLTVRKLNNYDETGNASTSNLDVINGTTKREVVLRRRVVVDPKPELHGVSISQEDSKVTASFKAKDQFGQPESARLKANGKTFASISEISLNTPNSLRSKVPESVSGETVIRLEVEDGRGQTAVRTKTLDIPVQMSAITEEPASVWLGDVQTGEIATPPSYAV